MTQHELSIGEEAPKPPPTFDALALGPDVRKALDKMGYLHPTPVQLAVYEPASQGRSLVVQARTGTGKTTAFGLPIIDALVKRSVPGVQALILTPTRELSIQVARELEQIAEFRELKIVPIYGGAPMERQVDALAGGAQIVSGTPGRVLDHLRRGTLDPSNIRIFVLDEADEMLSMGFAKELNAIIERLPRDRQGLYFSATLPPDVERLANSHLHEPEWITLSSDQVGALSISHFVYLVREGDKRSALLRIVEVENPESAVVFCNTKDETERVAEALKSRGYDADWLNGDLDQRERERVMAKTKEGKLRFLVATDVAARGIDISHLTHVINADFPESAEQYVHRTGRTGRAGRTGTAISVVGPKDVGHLYMLRLTYKIRPVERVLPTAGELRTRQEADLVTFLTDAYAQKKVDPVHLAVARRLLTHGAAETIVAGLLADHLGASGSTEEVTQQAADARRAKNPPAEPTRAEPAKPAPGAGHIPNRGGRRELPSRRDARPEPQREARPEPRRDARPEPQRDARPEPRRDARPEPRRDVRPEPARDARAEARPAQGRDRDRDRPHHGGDRPRPPQSALSSWEPPADDDDDRPLLDDGARRAARERSRSGDPSRSRPANDRPRTPHHGRDLPLPSIGFTVEGETESEAFDTAVTLRPPPPAPDAAPPTSRSSQRAPNAERPRTSQDHVNVFLNVGRRDGLTPTEVGAILRDDAGIKGLDEGDVRIRERITFVTVRTDDLDRALRAFGGKIIGGRTVNAERARER